MEFTNWKLEKIENIRAAEFFKLIEKNKDHISKTFPVTLSGCASLEKTVDFIEKAKTTEQNKEGYYFYIRNLATQDLIGYVCIKSIDSKIAKCELAYFVDKDFEGKGIISKAVSQTIDFCFKEIGMNKVFISTSKINTASQRIATKHGFQQEGILRQEFKNGEGILEDIVYFGLLKSDYYKNEK